MQTVAESDESQKDEKCTNDLREGALKKGDKTGNEGNLSIIPTEYAVHDNTSNQSIKEQNSNINSDYEEAPRDIHNHEKLRDSFISPQLSRYESDSICIHASKAADINDKGSAATFKKLDSSQRRHSFLYITNASTDDDSEVENNAAAKKTWKSNTTMKVVSSKVDYKTRKQNSKLADKIRHVEVSRVASETPRRINNKIPPSAENRVLKNDSKNANDIPKKLSNKYPTEAETEKSGNILNNPIRKTLYSATELSNKRDAISRKHSIINSKTMTSLELKDNLLNRKRNTKHNYEELEENSDCKEYEDPIQKSKSTIKNSMERGPRKRATSSKNRNDEIVAHNSTTKVRVNSGKSNVDLPTLRDVKAQDTKDTDNLSNTKKDSLSEEKGNVEHNETRDARIDVSSTHIKIIEENRDNNDAVTDIKIKSPDVAKTKFSRAFNSTSKLSEGQKTRYNTISQNSLRRPLSQKIPINQGTSSRSNSTSREEVRKLIKSESYVIIKNDVQDAQKNIDNESHDKLIKVSGPLQNMSNPKSQLIPKSRLPSVSPNRTTQMKVNPIKIKSSFKIKGDQTLLINKSKGKEVASTMSQNTSKQLEQKNDCYVTDVNEVVIHARIQQTQSRIHLRERKRKESERLSVRKRRIIDESWTDDISSNDEKIDSEKDHKTSGSTSQRLHITRSKHRPRDSKTKYDIASKSAERNLKEKTNLKKNDLATKSLAPRSGNIPRRINTGRNRDSVTIKSAHFHRSRPKSHSNSAMSRGSSGSSDPKSRIPRSQGSSVRSNSSKVSRVERGAHDPNRADANTHEQGLVKTSVGSDMETYKIMNNPRKPGKNYIKLNIARASRGQKEIFISQKQIKLISKNKGNVPTGDTMIMDEQKSITKINKTDGDSQKNEVGKESCLSGGNIVSKHQMNISNKDVNDIIINLPNLRSKVGIENSMISYTTHKVVTTLQKMNDKDNKTPIAINTSPTYTSKPVLKLAHDSPNTINHTSKVGKLYDILRADSSVSQKAKNTDTSNKKDNSLLENNNSISYIEKDEHNKTSTSKYNAAAIKKTSNVNQNRLNPNKSPQTSPSKNFISNKGDAGNSESHLNKMSAGDSLPATTKPGDNINKRIHLAKRTEAQHKLGSINSRMESSFPRDSSKISHLGQQTDRNRSREKENSLSARKIKENIRDRSITPNRKTNVNGEQLKITSEISTTSDKSRASIKFEIPRPKLRDSTPTIADSNKNALANDSNNSNKIIKSCLKSDKTYSNVNNTICDDIAGANTTQKPLSKSVKSSIHSAGVSNISDASQRTAKKLDPLRQKEPMTSHSKYALRSSYQVHKREDNIAEIGGSKTKSFESNTKKFTDSVHPVKEPSGKTGILRPKTASILRPIDKSHIEHTVSTTSGKYNQVSGSRSLRGTSLDSHNNPQSEVGKKNDFDTKTHSKIDTNLTTHTSSPKGKNVYQKNIEIQKKDEPLRTKYGHTSRSSSNPSKIEDIANRSRDVANKTELSKSRVTVAATHSTEPYKKRDNVNRTRETSLQIRNRPKVGFSTTSKGRDERKTVENLRSKTCTVRNTELKLSTTKSSQRTIDTPEKRDIACNTIDFGISVTKIQSREVVGIKPVRKSSNVAVTFNRSSVIENNSSSTLDTENEAVINLTPSNVSATLPMNDLKQTVNVPPKKNETKVIDTKLNPEIPKFDNTLVIGDISQGIAVIIRPKTKIKDEKYFNDFQEIVEDARPPDDYNISIGNVKHSLSLPCNISHKVNNSISTTTTTLDGKESEENPYSELLKGLIVDRVFISDETFHREGNNQPTANTITNNCLTFSIECADQAYSLTNVHSNKLMGIRENLLGVESERGKSCASIYLQCNNPTKAESIPNERNTGYGDDFHNKQSDVLTFDRTESPRKPLVHAITILTRENNVQSNPEPVIEKPVQICDSKESIYQSEVCDDDQAFLTASDSERVDDYEVNLKKNQDKSNAKNTDSK